MEVTTDLSEKIVDAIQNAISFFMNQSLFFYVSILFLIVLVVFIIAHICNSIALMKKCYRDIDHVGFRKINVMNLASVMLFMQIHPDWSIFLNIYFGIFIIPILAWMVFMLKLFIFNWKKYKTKKNFVKEKKKRAAVEKQIGAGHRISRTDLHGVYQTHDEFYKDCKPLECQEITQRRLTNDILFNRKD